MSDSVTVHLPLNLDAVVSAWFAARYLTREGVDAGHGRYDHHPLSAVYDECLRQDADVEHLRSVVDFTLAQDMNGNGACATVCREVQDVSISAILAGFHAQRLEDREILSRMFTILDGLDVLLRLVSRNKGRLKERATCRICGIPLSAEDICTGCQIARILK